MCPLIRVGVSVSRARAAALQSASQPIPPIEWIVALIDTGASRTAVDRTVISKLGLTPTGSVLISTPSTGQNPAPMNTYDVGIVLYDHEDKFIIDRPAEVTANDLSKCGCQMLLGTDILKRCLFVYDGRAERFSLAF